MCRVAEGSREDQRRNRRTRCRFEQESAARSACSADSALKGSLYADFSSKQTPDHGREPCAPEDSGSIENMRSISGSRSSFAAVFRIDRTSIGFHPYDSKKGGP